MFSPINSFEVIFCLASEDPSNFGKILATYDTSIIPQLETLIVINNDKEQKLYNVVQVILCYQTRRAVITCNEVVN